MTHEEIIARLNGEHEGTLVRNLGIVFIPDLSYQNQVYTWPDVMFSILFLAVLHLPFLADKVFSRPRSGADKTE